MYDIAGGAQAVRRRPVRDQLQRGDCARRLAQGRARHRAQRGALCRDGVGHQGVRAHVGGQAALRSAVHPQPGRDSQRGPPCTR